MSTNDINIKYVLTMKHLTSAALLSQHDQKSYDANMEAAIKELLRDCKSQREAVKEAFSFQRWTSRTFSHTACLTLTGLLIDAFDPIEDQVSQKDVSTTQVDIIPVLTNNVRIVDWSQEIFETLSRNNINCTLNMGDETFSTKLRNSSNQGIPHIILIGNRQALSRQMSIRESDKTVRENVDLDSFIEQLTGTEKLNNNVVSLLDRRKE